MEADHIDSAATGTTVSGNTTVMGVEMDAIGRRVAYWLYPEHPGALATSVATRRLSSVPVPADGVIHLYERQRTQTRGVPWGAPVIRKLRDLDDYEFAEGIRKKTEAAYVGVLLTDGDEDATAGGKKLGHLTDAQGNTVEQVPAR
jgi:capsid protein